MKRTETRTKENGLERPLIKVRISNNESAKNAVEIQKHWKTQRKCAPKTVDAIRLYDALERGDKSLLIEFFPAVAFSMGAGQSVSGWAANGAIDEIELQTEIVEVSVEDQIDNLLFG